MRSTTTFVQRSKQDRASISGSGRFLHDLQIGHWMRKRSRSGKLRAVLRFQDQLCRANIPCSLTIIRCCSPNRLHYKGPYRCQSPHYLSLLFSAHHPQPKSLTDHIAYHATTVTRCSGVERCVNNKRSHRFPAIHRQWVLQRQERYHRRLRSNQIVYAGQWYLHRQCLPRHSKRHQMLH
jgi:hypothetical protein